MTFCGTDPIQEDHSKQGPAAGDSGRESSDSAVFKGREGAPQYFDTGTWRDWLPIRKLSDAEWQEYQQKKAEAFQRK